jgi:Activator of Hsp90 ATPase, N-terminal
VALAGGKKCYIFDFHVKMTYEMKDAVSNAAETGKVRIPDISSALHDELDVVFEDSGNPAHANCTRTCLASEIRKQVQLWVNDFNKKY